VLGNVTTYTQEKQNLMLVDVNDDIQKPIIQKQVIREQRGDQWVTEERDVITGYKTIHRTHRVPEEIDTDAEIGLAVRMVNVQTGEILWSASWSKRSSNVEKASEILSERIMKALRKAWPIL